jgi:hypothetical protein
MTRLEEIELEMIELDKVIKLKEKVWDNSKPYEEYYDFMKAEFNKQSQLSRERRMLVDYKLSELSMFGDVMSLETFIANCKCGGFIDYDGYGYYVKDGKESNIEIYPSDVKHGAVRKDFDTIIWFNR